MQPDRVAAEMKKAWNTRAEKDAFFYIETEEWDGDVARFFALGEERSRLLIDPVLRRIGLNPAGKAALDFGCGVGRFTRALATRFAHCIGVDVSEGMVSRALRLHADWRDRTDFRSSDGVSLPVADDSVDFVFSYEVFQHFPSERVAQSGFAHVGRVLRQGGYGLIHCKIAHERSSTLHTIYRQVPNSLSAAIHRLRGKDVLTSDAAFRGTLLPKTRIAEMCQAAGLQVLEFRDDPTHLSGTRTFAVVQAATN